MPAPEERLDERRVRSVPAVPRVPPHDLQAEAQLLGVMLLDEAAAATGLAGCAPEDFYRVSHAHVAAALAAVVERGEAADSHAVSAELRRAGLLDGLSAGDSQGPAVIVSLMAAAAMRYQVGGLASTVARYARARAMIAKAGSLADAGYSVDLEQGAAVAAEVVEDLGLTDLGASTWAPIDVATVIDNGLESSQPTILLRSDGTALLYPGKVHALNAPPEAAKTLLALHACAERINAGEHVLYVDFEDDAQGILERLAALGVERDAAAERFHYIRPDEPFGGVARAQLLNLVRLYRPTLAILDGVAEAMAMNNWSENDNSDVAAFLTALPRLLEREGCCVVLIDHLVKDAENQGRYARGAGHKLAGLSGSAYKLEVTRAFGRGTTGSVRMVVTKDRPGWVRRGAVGPRVADVEFTSSTTGDTITVKVLAPDTAPASFRPTYLMESVSRCLEGSPDPLSVNAVLATTSGNRSARITALKCLVDEGYVERSTSGQAHLHRSARPFRESEQTPSPVGEQTEMEDF